MVIVLGIIIVNIIILILYLVARHIRLHLLEKGLSHGNLHEVSGREALEESLKLEGLLDFTVSEHVVPGEDLVESSEGQELTKVERKKIDKIKKKIKQVNNSLDPSCDIDSKEIKLSSKTLDYTNLVGLSISLYFSQYLKRIKNPVELMQIRYYENKKKMFYIIFSGVMITSLGFLGTFINLIGLLFLIVLGGAYISKAFIEIFIKRDLSLFLDETDYIDESEREYVNKYLLIYMSNTYILIITIFLYVLSRGFSMIF